MDDTETNYHVIHSRWLSYGAATVEGFFPYVGVVGYLTLLLHAMGLSYAYCKCVSLL